MYAEEKKYYKKKVSCEKCEVSQEGYKKKDVTMIKGSEKKSVSWKEKKVEEKK